MEKPKKRRIIRVRYDEAYKKLEREMDRYLSRLNGMSQSEMFQSLAKARR